MSIDGKKYWNSRLSQDKTLIGTGHRSFNLTYNQALYEMQTCTVDLLLQTNRVDPVGKCVLDVGSGFGFYVNYFLTRGASSVTGIDIAPTSVEYLQQTYPQSQFYCVDVGAIQELPVASQFDIVSAVSVLYHIVEDTSFKQALINICRATVPGGYLLVNDMFKVIWQPWKVGHCSAPLNLDTFSAILS